MKVQIVNTVSALRKEFNERTVVRCMIMFVCAAFTFILSCGSIVFAAGKEKKLSGGDLSAATFPIVELVDSFATPLLAIVGVFGVAFCIVLGVRGATAEEPQKREKNWQSLKKVMIGFVLIFVFIIALKLSIGPVTTWMKASLKTN